MLFAKSGNVTIPNMHPVLPSGKSLLACALYGIISTGIGETSVLIGRRIIIAGMARFIVMLDVVLGPISV